MKKILIISLFCVQSMGALSQVWVEQSPPVGTPELYSVFAYSSTIAWVCGDQGTVLCTSTSGATWIPRGSALFLSNNMYGIFATSQDTAYVVCSVAGAGKVFKTTDAGLNWVQKFTRPSTSLKDIEFVDSQTGYVYGNPSEKKWFIIRTTNAGASWDSVNVTRPASFDVDDLAWPNALHVKRIGVGGPITIWFGTNAAAIMRSTNSGAFWTSSATQSSNVFSITFINDQIGFAGGQVPYRTLNGGLNWTVQINYPNSGDFFSFVNSSGYLFYSSGFKICVSTNTGTSFAVQYSQPNQENYNHMGFVTVANDNAVSTLTGWGVTDEGSISHYTETIGISTISTTIPEEFKLKQNYPNPFNPVTYINFDIPKRGNLSLKVFDVNGRLVRTIFAGVLNAGSYKADFDASELPSAAYFYRLETEDYIETRKMVLIK
ncbi:MAG: T9SS type A sorting domain-containing protein [Ignavibacteria bacterium]|nr:T9SS type A sorting domain-containing protein [Ignavibacteria bacterium]